MLRTVDLLAFYLPLLEVAAAMAIIAAGTAYLFRVGFVRHRWLTICMRLAGAVVVVLLVLASILLVSLAACMSRPRMFVSPDGKHVADYTYNAGFLGRDSTVVSVRNKWGIRRKLVYQYSGPSDWTGTEVRWLSNDRLSVRYYVDQSRFQECRAAAAGIVVECIPVTR